MLNYFIINFTSFSFISIFRKEKKRPGLLIPELGRPKNKPALSLSLSEALTAESYPSSSFLSHPTATTPVLVTSELSGETKSTTALLSSSRA
jgi:hypothetical protein